MFWVNWLRQLLARYTVVMHLHLGVEKEVFYAAVQQDSGVLQEC